MDALGYSENGLQSDHMFAPLSIIWWPTQLGSLVSASHPSVPLWMGFEVLPLLVSIKLDVNYGIVLEAYIQCSWFGSGIQPSGRTGVKEM